MARADERLAGGDALAPTTRITLRRWHEAIGHSDLQPAERHLCFTLLVWANTETGVCWPSVAKIALFSGYEERSVRRVLARLAGKEVLMYLKKSRGGPRATHRMQLSLAGLEARRTKAPNPDPGSGLGVEDGRAQPGPAIPVTRTGDPANPDPGSGELPLELPNEPPPQPPAGGGGGRVAARQGEAEAAGPDFQAALDALLAEGVSKRKAGELARRHGLAVVNAGIDWMNRNGGDPDSRAAILVTVLEDGTAQDAHDRAERSKAKAREQQLQARRVRRLQELRGWTFDRATPEVRPDVQRGWGTIERAWPTLKEVASAGVVPDDVLLAQQTKGGWAIFDDLVSAAQAKLGDAQKPQGGHR